MKRTIAPIGFAALVVGLVLGLGIAGRAGDPRGGGVGQFHLAYGKYVDSSGQSVDGVFKIDTATGQAWTYTEFKDKKKDGRYSFFWSPIQD